MIKPYAIHIFYYHETGSVEFSLKDATEGAIPHLSYIEVVYQDGRESLSVDISQIAVDDNEWICAEELDKWEAENIAGRK